MSDLYRTPRMWFSDRWEQLIGVPAPDEEAARQGRLFNIMMVISTGITTTVTLILLLMPSLGLTSITLSLLLAVFPFALMLFSIFCLIQARMGRVRTMVLLYAWANFVCISLAIFFADGIHSSAWLFYFWTITIAGTLLSPIYALWMTGGTVVYFLLLLLLLRAGIYTPFITLSAEGLEFTNIAFRIIMTVSTVGLLTYLNMKSLKNALSHLRTTKVELEEHHRMLEQNITERTSALNEANEKLTLWTEELVDRNQKAELLSSMGDFIQGCQSVEEAYTILAQTMQQLFPDDSGAMFIFRNSRNLLEVAAVWGKTPPQEMTFAPNDCWALRRGRYHGVTDTDTGTRCKHIGKEMNTYLCMPVISQDEVLGLFHLVKNTGDETSRAVTWLEDNRRVVQRITEQIGLLLGNIKLRETLKALSIRDPLTGLFNRRFMEESFGREFSLATRNNNSIGIIMMDIDHFKRLNDTFGHEAGDVTLVEIGALIQKSVRSSDIACRYGGEEFVIILPEASLAITLQRAEHIREQVKHLYLTHTKQPLGSITISAGVAVFPHHGKKGESVLHAADTALYQAKKTGRDRVCVASVDEDAAA